MTMPGRVVKISTPFHSGQRHGLLYKFLKNQESKNNQNSKRVDAYALRGMSNLYNLSTGQRAWGNA